jgi:hypothetical protein
LRYISGQDDTERCARDFPNKGKPGLRTTPRRQSSLPGADDADGDSDGRESDAGGFCPDEELTEISLAELDDVEVGDVWYSNAEQDEEQSGTLAG